MAEETRSCWMQQMKVYKRGDLVKHILEDFTGVIVDIQYLSSEVGTDDIQVIQIYRADIHEVSWAMASEITRVREED